MINDPKEDEVKAGDDGVNRDSSLPAVKVGDKLYDNLERDLCKIIYNCKGPLHSYSLI